MITVEWYFIPIMLVTLTALWMYVIARERFFVALGLVFTSIFIPLALLGDVISIRT